MRESRVTLASRSNPSGQKIWGVRIPDPSRGGGYRREYNRDWKKRDAEKRRDELNKRLGHGEPLTGDSETKTVGDLAEQMKATRFNRSSWDTYEKYAIRRFVEYFGEHRKLKTINFSHLEQYARELWETPLKDGKQRSAVTYNRELATIRLAFNKAISYGWVARNPIHPHMIDPEKDTGENFSLFKKEQRKTEFLQGQQIAEILKASKGWPHTDKLIRFALNTGGDRSTLLNLKWSDINLEVDNPYVRFYRPKVRDYYLVRLNKDALDVLKEIRMESIPRHDDYVFKYDGRKIQRVDRSIRAIYRKAGIEISRPFHALRHTFGTQFYAETKDLLRTSRTMGHTETKTTERYVHLVEDLGIESVLKLTDYNFDTKLTQSAKSEKIASHNYLK